MPTRASKPRIPSHRSRSATQVFGALGSGAEVGCRVGMGMPMPNYGPVAFSTDMSSIRNISDVSAGISSGLLSLR
jgi:hypothetical protein